MDVVKLQKMRFTGTLVHYMAVCPRKAWLFAKGIGQEQNSTLVEIGKWISETSYPDRRHEIEIDRTIVLDWIDWKNKVIHEVKKSSKMEEAHRLQVQYYIYYLERKGLPGFTAVINYPTQRRLQQVHLTEDDRQHLESLLEQLQHLLEQAQPPKPQRIGACRQCAYYEFCWV